MRRDRQAPSPAIRSAAARFALRMLIQQLSVTTSVFLATRRLGFRLDVDQGFQNFLERAGIFW